jgi:hypothetical protein
MSLVLAILLAVLAASCAGTGMPAPYVDPFARLADAETSPYRVDGSGFVLVSDHPKHPGDTHRVDIRVHVTIDPRGSGSTSSATTPRGRSTATARRTSSPAGSSTRRARRATSVLIPEPHGASFRRTWRPRSSRRILTRLESAVAAIEVSSKVEASVREDLKDLADESH